MTTVVLSRTVPTFRAALSRWNLLSSTFRRYISPPVKQNIRQHIVTSTITIGDRPDLVPSPATNADARRGGVCDTMSKI
eukprot:2045939-Pyramimonas_sp.AAC.1